MAAVNYLVCAGSFDWTSGCTANAGGTVDCGQKQIAQCVNRKCDRWGEGFGTACEFNPNTWTNVAGVMCSIRNCDNAKP